MDELEQWVYLDGPAPTSVRPLLDALGDGPIAGPTPEEKARLMDAFFASFEERVARAGAVAEPEARASDVAPAPAAEMAMAMATGTATTSVPPLQVGIAFEVWAAVSIRLLGAGEDEKRAEVARLGMDLDAWGRVDAAYLRALSDDMRANRRERPERYAALCRAEAARRGDGDGDGDGDGGTNEGAAPAASVKAPAALKGTAEAFEVPAEVRASMGKLPFAPAPAAGASAAGGSARTLKVRAMPSPGTTLGVTDDAITRAVQSLPFAGGAGPAAVVAIPDLTVKQYVSLRMELAAGREPLVRTLERYRVANEAALRALEALWQERFAVSSELRAERDAAVEEYARWLRGG